MGELDYQMALLLQHRFEQEYKASRNEQKSDYELARLLQEQYEQEEASERPSTSLVYDCPKKQLNSSKSLTDPSWELADPTPDIHTLFLAFNQRFFWNKLLAVCVSWSKRMTSCAGVCSYNGRGGMCSITLSEPLLKLRPRKDLVETLLHEMIHAYLFVTHNNKDRDGHGPEFHKHMYRINKESGTNITVYHDFHDEVRLYKQHWWRCNGPCQHRKPYFGMVRRATNRAPGPYDRWWAEHSTTCGGTFIKVKEPEKKIKPAKKVDAKNGDIRNFIPVVKNSGGSGSNVKGFKDLAKKVQGKFNSSSTIVVTKNTNTSTSSFKPTIFNSDNTRDKTETRRDNCTDDFLTVRNHWANKFNNTNKRPSPLENENRSKIPKNSESVSESNDQGECPVCNKKVLMADLNHHLDVCLTKDCANTEPETIDLTDLEEKECPLCNQKVKSSSFDGHVEKCLMKIYGDVEKKLEGSKSSKEEKEKVACLACGKEIFKDELNTHLDDCMNDIFKVEVDGADDKQQDDRQFNCPFCLKLVSEAQMKEHLDGCLSSGDVDVVQSWTDSDF
ncbi:SprT-like domain containing protein [Asbolus verrucosus]|uniref:Protein with SprT-like domain at the N terminus n=1 Tax=Asbolus verrucosus TaxID=1661398 RepID=A0A482VUK8_ASBVE|nr:SprT-like domain containing protein [Asbolus verrucosus]